MATLQPRWINSSPELAVADLPAPLVDVTVILPGITS